MPSPKTLSPLSSLLLWRLPPPLIFACSAVCSVIYAPITTIYSIYYIYHPSPPQTHKIRPVVPSLFVPLPPFVLPSSVWFDVVASDADFESDPRRRLRSTAADCSTIYRRQILHDHQPPPIHNLIYLKAMRR